MNKNLLNFLAIVLILVFPARSMAQISPNPVRQNGPVYQIAPLPSNISPEDIIKPDPSAKESNRQIPLNPPAGPGKQLQPKTSTDQNEQRISPVPAVQVSKYGTVVQSYSPEEKASWTEAQHNEYQRAHTFGDVSAQTAPGIIVDLQVTATPESPEIQALQGSEKLPEKFKADKPAEISETEKTAPQQSQTPGIGKVDFLKQYAAELKSQIEKNKKNAQYPHAAKLQELEALEQLLKQAE